MSNINDYLQWRGDISIDDTYEFNEIDSLILARFSYLIFNKIKMESKETIESISKKMKDFDNDDFRYNGDKELITNLGKSKRFKNMVVSDYIDITDKKVEKQFSAITIHISKKELYVSFIGTDASLVGWKEDCNMAFMKNVPAQYEGINYLNVIANKYPKSKIRIGGHSKGGNIAIYSAISVPEKIQKRIIRVSNYDGPGLDKAIVDNYEDNGMLHKIVTFIPQDSIIGRFLNHEEKIYIVESIEKGIYQHDVYSWQVLGKDFIYLNELTNSSEVVYNTVNEWLKNTTVNQRKIFFDGLFEVFYSSSANTFGEMSSNLLKSAPTLFKTYKGISEEDRKTINLMIKEFVKAYATAFKETESQKENPFKRLHGSKNK